MRIYYVFKIKEEFVSLYKETPSVLYNILNQLYYMRKTDVNYGCNLYFQMIDELDKYTMDQAIFIEMHDKMRYSKRKDEHIINNLYKDEVSIMKIKNTYIVINCNKDYTEFFEIINRLSVNLFVCDFSNNDYFFTSKVKLLV